MNFIAIGQNLSLTYRGETAWGRHLLDDSFRRVWLETHGPTSVSPKYSQNCEQEGRYLFSINSDDTIWKIDTFSIPKLAANTNNRLNHYNRFLSVLFAVACSTCCVPGCLNDVIMMIQNAQQILRLKDTVTTG